MTLDELKAWGPFLQGELLVMKDSFRERGPKFFQRPLGLGLVIVFAAYWYVYLPPLAKMSRIEEDLAASKASAQYVDDYKSLSARLESLFAKLPRVKNPGGWLLEEVRKSLREEGIVPLSTSPPTEQKIEAYRFISMEVRCQATYPQLASWIARLEGGNNLFFIKELNIRKDAEPIGSNTAAVVITTVVPAGSGG
ncbi:MAG: hypothetical protein AUJ52_08315 [Elusimicrobia bacterium CG1_02_63_36]|nr:MAG: hypothetical protein AUJ52_08315 [Elusimicrobia bacterium CG1_02_63_36]PIP81548.1 MAG: hypothetical protein COR54_19620 [Elusimicrobia bacterium CG22_combo_CG10-13_8_21_14_all_63_91]PJA13251.1 MAG: hypothetical protein COX66_15465 [Elusimicrobia bacterium CG_4_10_14_0_2_um_filter_63_34]PJB25720.1 MAG: hypothetical protein CO113_07205 [Elusimicrobia bacterium CG_4_9_14_3_um_filter_62_55]